MSTREELAADVGSIGVVVRLLPTGFSPPAWRESQPPRLESEDAFDAAALETLRGHATFLQRVIDDALGDRFAVRSLEIRTSSSIEVVVVIAAAYKILTQFNEISDAMSRARDNLQGIVGAALHAAGLRDFLATGHSSVAVLDGLVSATGPSLPPILQVSPPLGWTRDALLRVVIPLAMVTWLAVLIVGVFAAVRALN
jgi:hypothetical protein